MKKCYFKSYLAIIEIGEAKVFHLVCNFRHNKFSKCADLVDIIKISFLSIMFPYK